MSIYLIWFLIGIGFFAFEMISPLFIFFFFGLGAWITSLIAAVFPDLTFNTQMLIFGISSIGSLIVLRNYMTNVFLGSQNSGEDKYDNVLSKGDSSAVLTKAIKAGAFGEIKFKGTFYKAKCENLESELSVGQHVTVIQEGDEQGSFYIVKKIKEEV